MAFSLDTSFFIQGWYNYHPDVFPGVWRLVSDHIDCGDLFASSEVMRELAVKDDVIHEWAKQRKHLFIDVDQPTMDFVPKIMNVFPHAVKQGKQRSSGDVFVVSLAYIRGFTVVTEERPGGSRIPEICQHFEIPCINTVQMMQQLGFRFE